MPCIDFHDGVWLINLSCLMPAQAKACLWTMWESKNILALRLHQVYQTIPGIISNTYVARVLKYLSSPLVWLVKGCLIQYCMSPILNLYNNQFNCVFQSPVSWCPAHLSLDMSGQIFVVEILKCKFIKISEHFKPLILLSYAKESNFVENDLNHWLWRSGPLNLNTP